MPRMEYVEHAPPLDLHRHVQCLWILRDDAPDDAIQVIYPDGRCELLAELGVPLRFHGPDGEIRADQALAFAGQQLRKLRWREKMRLLNRLFQPLHIKLFRDDRMPMKFNIV